MAWHRLKGGDMNFRCFFGFHSGEWVYANRDSCEQERICGRDDCNNVKYRTEHEALGPWELDNPRDHTNCQGSAACRRCGESIPSVEHEYGWRYTSDDNCEQARICIRCDDRNYSTETRVQHSWEWQYNQNGNKVCICRHCGEDRSV
jgi:hypothetical protein